MKPCSAATQALLASRQYGLYQLYDFILPTGQQYHITDGEVPLNGVQIYTNDGVIGPFNYSTGLAIICNSIDEQSGTEASQMKLTLVPVVDAASGPVQFAGYPMVQAARWGFLQGMRVRMSKFLYSPPVAGAQIQTSQGAMGYFYGTAQDIQPDRFSMELGVEGFLGLLGDQQMPKAIMGEGCFHQVYDAGCGLLQATFTVSGTIATAGDVNHFTTNLTQVDGYFELGGLVFDGNVTAALAGQSVDVSSFKHSSGAIITANAVSVLPVAGDTFKIWPGCDRQQLGGCTKLANTARFAGIPYMPVPETILDGGTSNPTPQKAGAQAGQLIGSQVSAQQSAGKYRS